MTALATVALTALIVGILAGHGWRRVEERDMAACDCHSDYHDLGVHGPGSGR